MRQRSTRPTNKTGYRIPVDNPEALAEELCRVVSERFDGNHSAAARAAKLKQPHFTKLCAARFASVTRKTANALRQLLPANRRTVFDTLLLNEKALYLVLKVYRPWVDEAADRVFHGSAYDWHLEQGDVKQYGGGGQTTYFNRLTIAMEIQAEWLTQFAGYLAPLDRAIERGGHSLNRRAVSLFRMCEPLLDHHASGLIERGWHELSRAEKERFISAGVRRELILLNRAHDALRATQVVSGRSIVTLRQKR